MLYISNYAVAWPALLILRSMPINLEIILNKARIWKD